MRQVAVNVYNYFELDDKAKEKAYNDFCYSMEYPYHYENEKSLYAVADECNVSIQNWEYDTYSHRFNVFLEDEELDGMYGKELRDYLINNFYDYMLGKKEVYGYYLDYEFFHEMAKALEDIEENHVITYRDVMYRCFHAMFEAINDDIQNFYSIGNFEEMTEMNEWEYTEDGSLY